jgi:hypothetical protein
LIEAGLSGRICEYILREQQALGQEDVASHLLHVPLFVAIGLSQFDERKLKSPLYRFLLRVRLIRQALTGRFDNNVD